MRLLRSSLVALCLLTTALRAEKLRIVGTDLGGDALTSALRTAAQTRSIDLSVDLTGSQSALENLLSGKADIALILARPDTKIENTSLVTRPLAYVTASVVVAKDCDISQLTFQQLDGIFGAEGPGGINTWSDLGSTHPQNARLRISAQLLAPTTNQLAADLAAHTAFHTPRYRANVARHTTLASTLEQLREGQGAIAIIPGQPPASAALKTVAISRSANEPAFTPTTANIHAGDYPLRMSILLCYRTSDTARLAPLLEFFSNAQTATLLQKADLIVAPQPDAKNS